jgi:hypothetical protein
MRVSSLILSPFDSCVRHGESSDIFETNSGVIDAGVEDEKSEMDWTH